MNLFILNDHNIFTQFVEIKLFTASVDNIFLITLKVLKSSDVRVFTTPYH